MVNFQHWVLIITNYKCISIAKYFYGKSIAMFYSKECYQGIFFHCLVTFEY